jgi:hypothetical protein
MGESLTQRRRVRDEGLRDRKPLSEMIKVEGLIPLLPDLSLKGSPG